MLAIHPILMNGCVSITPSTKDLPGMQMTGKLFTLKNLEVNLKLMPGKEKSRAGKIELKLLS